MRIITVLAAGILGILTPTTTATAAHTVAAVTVNTTVTADTPTITVDSTMMTMFITQGLADNLHQSYQPALTAAIVAFGDVNLATDVVDAYLIVTMEDAGGLRLTPEARVILTDYLHS